MTENGGCMTRNRIHSVYDHEYDSSEEEHITTEVMSSADERPYNGYPKKIETVDMDRPTGYDQLQVIEESEEISFSMSSVSKYDGEDTAILPAHKSQHIQDTDTFKLL